MGTALGLVMSALVAILGIVAMRIGFGADDGLQARVGGAVITVIGVVGIVIGLVGGVPVAGIGAGQAGLAASPRFINQPAAAAGTPNTAAASSNCVCV